VFQTGRTVSGPGLSLRLDLSPSRSEWVRGYKRYRATLDPTYKKAGGREAKPLAAVNNQFSTGSSEPPYDEFLEDFVGSARKLRISAFLTHQWLDSTRLATGGLSLSQVISTRCYNSEMERVWGVVPRIAFQGIARDLTQAQSAQFGLSRSSSAVRTSLGLALQDNIPRLLYKGPKDRGRYPADTRIARWTFQLGAEYVYRNVTDGDESYGIYARFRSLEAHNETSLSLSRTPYKDVQFGLSFTFTHE
jgi:hypothetical protein